MNERNPISVDEAVVLDHAAYAGDQYVLRLQTPRIAESARPGSFVHVRCADHLPMRRPLSIMRASAADGWIEVLYRVVGEGTALLSRTAQGERLSLIGPIGVPFQIDEARTLPLLIGGGVGVPPMVFLADSMRQLRKGLEPLVLMGSETPFPFRARPSQIMVPGVPGDVIAAMPLLEDWGIASRLASLQGYAGCHEGYVTDLARRWLRGLDAETLNRVQVFACGPEPMLAAVARLARGSALPCHVALAGYMACAAGGGAGRAAGNGARGRAAVSGSGRRLRRRVWRRSSVSTGSSSTSSPRPGTRRTGGQTSWPASAGLRNRERC